MDLNSNSKFSTFLELNIKPKNFPVTDSFFAFILNFLFPNFTNIDKIFILDRINAIMNLNIFLSPWTLFFTALIVIIVLLIALTMLEKKLKKKVAIKIEEKSIFHRKLNSLKLLNNKPREFLIAIDALARDFFSQHYNVDRNAKYSELAHHFKKSGNTPAHQFCIKIQQTMYSGENINRQKLDSLTSNIEFLIKEQNKTNETAKAKNEKPKMSFFKKQNNLKLDKRIVVYLAEGMKRGFKTEKLKIKLFEAGFTKEEVKLAENYLNLNSKKPAHVEESLQIEYEKVEPKKEEVKQTRQKDYPFIKSLDDLNRVKRKISQRTEMSGAKNISDKTGLV